MTGLAVNGAVSARGQRVNGLPAFIMEQTDSMTRQPLGTLARTHTCGALTVADAGQDVVLLGWVHRLRDLGSLAFIDIRDRHGVTQGVARDNPELVAAVQRLRAEYRMSAYRDLLNPR
jgi:hypothetical protein